MLNAVSSIVHAEPGEDKARFARDVGDWILARSARNNGQQGPSSGRPDSSGETSDDPESRSKL